MSDTAETIQTRLLANISDDYDKTEGSFFYDAEMPVAIELANAYADQEEILDKGFASTSTGSYLDKIVAEQGITRKAAVSATTTVTITGSEGSSISIGDLVSTDTVNFAATENKTIAAGATTMLVTVKCATAGIVGNVIAGAIKYFPVTLAGLTAVTNASAVTNGYDEESDAELRIRYYEKVQSPATSGNSIQYKLWAKSVTGVGDAKIFPLWNGNGTVKVLLINSNKREADSTLIDTVSTYIEGVRPIGATVTVGSAVEKAIDLEATLTLQIGYVLEDVQSAIETALTSHLANIAFADSYVSYAKVGSLILDIDGVLDYIGLTLNGAAANVIIADVEVAVLGVVSVSG